MRLVTRKNLAELNEKHYLEGLSEGLIDGTKYGVALGIVKVVRAKLPDGYLRETGEFYTGTGQRLSSVHARNSACDEHGCVIHNPSEHSMRKAKTHWRGDRGLMERICECGVGHPDPDDMNYIRRTQSDEYANAESIHGCCGCCV